LAGAALVAVGAGLFVVALREQARHRTDPNPWAETSALVTTGPYSWSRNPIYLADLVLQAGIGLAAGWWWALVLLPATWACLRFLVVRREERFLAVRFGTPYLEYRRRTRRWLGRG
ncbi:MAG TPA: isoprenylcysteine carboxylmethyltransferase family protein, partial [Candidatus Thermoplasmatota archaeon]|nr:isoprenylcysteine carboxylmethyltransferase family protein [Candidatus Thermoplasmatota archaeon]